MRVGFSGVFRGWKVDFVEMERVEEYKVGDWVRIRLFFIIVKYGLGVVILGSIGIVYCIRLDSSLLLELSYFLNFWYCELEEVEYVEFFRVIIFLIRS